jgi:hypothetical protein
MIEDIILKLPTASIDDEDEDITNMLVLKKQM